LFSLFVRFILTAEDIYAFYGIKIALYKQELN